MNKISANDADITHSLWQPWLTASRHASQITREHGHDWWLIGHSTVLCGDASSSCVQLVSVAESITFSLQTDRCRASRDHTFSMILAAWFVPPPVSIDVFTYGWVIQFRGLNVPCFKTTVWNEWSLKQQVAKNSIFPTLFIKLFQGGKHNR